MTKLKSSESEALEFLHSIQSQISSLQLGLKPKTIFLSQIVIKLLSKNMSAILNSLLRSSYLSGSYFGKLVTGFNQNTSLLVLMEMTFVVNIGPYK